MVVPSRLSCVNSSMISLALRGVQVAGRLVGEEQPRLGDDRARHADQLLLAAGELAAGRGPSCRRSGSGRGCRRRWPARSRRRAGCGTTAARRGSRRRSDRRAGGTAGRRSRGALGELGAVLGVQLVRRLAAPGSTRRPDAPSSMPRMASSVDLPAPDGPMMVMNSPGSMSRLIRRRTKVCPAGGLVRLLDVAQIAERGVEVTPGPRRCGWLSSTTRPSNRCTVRVGLRARSAGCA